MIKVKMIQLLKRLNAYCTSCLESVAGYCVYGGGVFVKP